MKPFHIDRRSTTGIIVMGFLSAILAACSGASAQWARQKQTTHQLDAIATVSLPQKFVFRDNETVQTPDYNSYNFRRTNDSHINGTTSYAEEMTVTVVAPDFPRERFDRVLSEGALSWMGKSPGLGEAAADGRRWLMRETVYESHPVKEPSWQVRVDDAKRGLVVTWRGFKKQYTLDDAKTNLSALVSAISVSPTIADDFATRRSWARTGWETAYAVNSRVAATVLAEFKLALPGADAMTREGKWRVYLDDQRPQQLHIAHELAILTLPEGPFRLTEKVTYYHYMQQRWVQENQGKESDMLPAGGQRLMAPEFEEQSKKYFYQIRAVDMWRTYPSEGEFADVLRNLLKSMLASHTKLLRDGFISGDAEP